MNEPSSQIEPYNFQPFYKLLERHVGIALDSTKEYLIVSRLTPIAKAHQFEDYIALLKHLEQTKVGDLHWACFEALTTNETFFFRDIFPFDALKTNILPDLMNAKRGLKELYIWCAAASTGQEPYSLAILMKENFPELNSWKLNIFATDIAQNVIDKAQSGIYNPTELQRGLSPDQIRRYFKKLPNGNFVIIDDLKKMVKFDIVNLVQRWPVMPKFDLILIRNVMIYFNQAAKNELVKKLHQQMLDKHSVLMLGSSESILFDTTFQVVQLPKVSYYKKII
ncbi:MAG: protein-glutamate O-methyltransferase CheR [Betaproteobacteria bacterium]|jgi:chemotaxis protein methyltransferase CheR